MFLLVFVAIAMGFLLIFFLTATSPQKKQFQSTPVNHKIQEDIWTREEFEEKCIAVTKSLGLEISNIYREKENMMEIFADNTAPFVGGRYIIHTIFHPPDGMVTQNNVATLSYLVKHEGATKGIFITTGNFEDSTEEIAKESPVELIDGIKLQKLIS